METDVETKPTPTPESGQFRFVLSFESDIDGDDDLYERLGSRVFSRLEISITRREDRVGMPGPVAQTLCVVDMMEFMAVHTMRVAVVYTLTQAGIALCKGVLPLPEPDEQPADPTTATHRKVPAP